MVAKISITIWPENEKRLNTIRGTLLKDNNKDMSQSAMINFILDEFFKRNPEYLDTPIGLFPDAEE